MKTPEQMAEERNDEKIKAARKYAKQYEGLMYTIGSIAGVSGIQMAFERGVAFGLHQALEITVEREKAERAAEQHWISVKETLPEDWDCVLWLAGTDGRFECGWEKNECANSACKTGCGQGFGAGAVFICEFHRKDKHHEQHYLIDDNNDIAFIDCFTHWMPLPEAPKEEW